MPKAIIECTLERNSNKDSWGFVVVGGKDQALTMKIGKIKAYSAAEKAGLKASDYIWTINGKEVFEMNHNDVVKLIKDSGNSLAVAVERGDHIVPNFEEIWPSMKKGKGRKGKQIGMDYYEDAMENGPDLTGHLPLPAHFTTVGKPGISVNQYDCPMECYSDDTLDEMKEDRLQFENPEAFERMSKLGHNPAKLTNDNPLAAEKTRKFDPAKSNALRFIEAGE